MVYVIRKPRWGILTSVIAAFVVALIFTCIYALFAVFSFGFEEGILAAAIIGLMSMLSYGLLLFVWVGLLAGITFWAIGIWHTNLE